MSDIDLNGLFGVDEGAQRQARENSYITLGSPAEAVEIRKTAKDLDMPAETIGLDPKLFKQEAETVKLDQALGDNQKLADFFAEKPINAQLAKDDYDPLNTVGKRAEDYSTPGLVSQIFDVMKERFGTQPVGWSDKQREMNPWLVRATETVPLTNVGIRLGDAGMRGLSAAISGTSVSLAEMWEALGYPDIPTGFPGISIPIDPALKSTAGKRRLARDIQIVQEGALAEAGMRPMVPTQMIQAAAEAAKKPFAEVLAPAERPIKPGESAVAEARRTAETVDAEIKEAPIVTPLGQKALERGEHLAPGLDPLHDQIHVAQQKVDFLKLDAEMRDAQNSQLRTRAPDEFANYLRKYHGDEEISVSAELIRDLYAKEGKEIAETDGLFGFVGDLREQVARGLSDGTEVRIPVADFIAHGDPTVYEKIKDNVRLRDGVTKEEAKELAKKKPEDYQGVQLVPSGPEGQFNTKGVKEIEYDIRKGDETVARALFTFDQKTPTSVKLQDIYSSKFFAGEMTPENIAKATEESRNLFGPSVMRDVLRKFREAHPEIEEITADRVSGARLGGKFDATLEEGVPITIKLPKPKDPVAQAVVEVIEAEQKAMWLDRVFDSPKTLGLTQDSFNRYSKKLEERAQAIDDKALKAAEREVARRQTPEYKRNEAETRAQVDNDLSYSPTFMADRFLRTGEYPGAERPTHFRLNRADVELRYGKGYLPENMLNKEGLPLDAAAPLFGFDSGEALARRLSLLENQRSSLGETPRAYYERIAKEETQRRMEERYGTLESVIRSEAEDMVARSTQEEILHIEMEGIAAQAGGKLSISLEQVRAAGKESFRQTPTKNALRIEQYVRAAGRTGELTEQALLKGKFDDAIRYKQQQIMATIALNEAKAYRKTMTKFEKTLDRLTEKTVRTVDQSALDQIHDIMRTVGRPSKRQPQELATAVKGKSLTRFVDAFESNLREVPVAEWLEDGSPRPLLEDMPVWQALELKESIDVLEHVGKEEKRISNWWQKEELDSVVQQAVAELERFNPIDVDLNPSIKQRAQGFRRWVSAAHILVERMLDHTDSFNPYGPFTSFVDRNLRQSATNEIIMIEKIAPMLKALEKFDKVDLTSQIENSLFRNPLNSKTGFMNMNRQNLRMVMLHMGNDSNFTKLADGFGITQDAIKQFVRERAIAEDFGWVNGMHRVFDALKGPTDEMYRRLTGVAPDTITPKGIALGTNVIEGGYAPLKYDSLRSKYFTDMSKNEVTPGLEQPGYFRATTPNSHAKQRTDYTGTLNISAGLRLDQTIRQIIHDITFREAIINAGKMLMHPDIQGAVTKYWGQQYTDLLVPWLKDIANIRNVDDGFSSGFINHMQIFRQNVISSMIFWNPSTILKHGPTALGLSIEEVGAQNFLQAVKDITSGLGKADSDWTFANESSAIVRLRMQKHANSIQGAYETAIGKGFDWNNPLTWRWAIMELGRTPVAFSDAVSAIPTWLAAYRRAAVEGADHADAVFQADKAMTRAHGSMLTMDKARVQRPGQGFQPEVMKFFTPLYNFFSHVYNKQLQIYWATGEAQKLIGKAESAEAKTAEIKKATPGIVNKLIWFVIFPTLVEEWVTGMASDTGEGFGKLFLKGLIRHMGAGIVPLRDITNWATAPTVATDPSLGMLGSIGKEGTKLYKDIQNMWNNAPAHKDWFTHATTSFGFITGWGGTQIGRFGTAAGELAKGRHPRTPGQFMTMLRTGRRDKRQVRK